MMKPQLQKLLLLVLLAGITTELRAQGTAFTYQGRLNLDGAPANGVYDLTFTVFGTNVTGVPVAGPTAVTGVIVSNGLFTTVVELGAGVFKGADRWLEISVRTNSNNAADPYTTLAPRQQIAAAPYAIYAGQAGSADALNGLLPASQLSGPIAPTNIAPGTITSGMLAPGAVSTLGAPDGAPSNAVVVDNNGNVGIGTSTPAAGLEIASGVPITTLPVLFEVQNGQYGWTNIHAARSAAANGSLLAVGGDTGLTLVNLTNPASPYMLTQIPNSTSGYAHLRNINGLAWAGSNLVAGVYGFGLNTGAVFIISCTNPASPVKLAEVDSHVNGWNYLDEIIDVAASGHLVAIVDALNDAVTLADISNPSAPVRLSTMVNGVNGYTNLHSVYSVALSGNLLAIGAYNGVTLVDVSNPSNPVKVTELLQGVGVYTNMDMVSSVALSGNILAIAAPGSDTVTLVDVSNPASPVKLAEMRDGEGGFAMSLPGRVALSGNRLAIASNGNAPSKPVTLADVSNPTRPVLLATASQAINGADLLLELYAITFAGSNLVTCGYGYSLVYPNVSAGGVTIFGMGTQSVGLSSAGWVGIGTTHPDAPLHVKGNVLVEGAALFNVSAPRVSLGAGADAQGYGSTALGCLSIASGTLSTAMGYQTTAGGTYSTAMGHYARAVHDNTFVWADGSLAPFNSTTTNEFSICAQNGVRIQADKGIHLNGTNAPLIVRDWDPFANNAPGSKAGIGRWGLFLETNALVAGIPGDDVGARYFRVAKYSTNGTPTTLMQVDQTGDVRVTDSLIVSGDARVAGLIRSGSERGTAQPPNPAGLVVRRVNSSVSTANSVVAAVHTSSMPDGTDITLVRDGTAGGFQIKYPATPGYLTFACMGIDTNGVARNFYACKANPASAGTVQIYTDAQAIVHFECTFGDTYELGEHLTRVTLTRYSNGATHDYYWAGDLVSTYNQ